MPLISSLVKAFANQSVLGVGWGRGMLIQAGARLQIKFLRNGTNEYVNSSRNLVLTKLNVYAHNCFFFFFKSKQILNCKSET